MDRQEKIIETLRREMEGLNSIELNDLFNFFYKLNYQYENMIAREQFDEFLKSFDKNPFKQQDDKTFKKQLIDNLIKYTYDHMSLITAVNGYEKKFKITTALSCKKKQMREAFERLSSKVEAQNQEKVGPSSSSV